MKGFAVLTAYKAGTYTPGMENTLNLDNAKLPSTDLIQRILADYNQMTRAEVVQPKDQKTFAEVYEEFFDWKYEQDKSKPLSQSSRNSTRSAFKNCAALHDRVFSALRYEDLQQVVDDCPRKHSTLELIVNLYHQMYKYAEAHELCDKDYSAYVQIKIPDDDEHGIPFTESDLHKLWKDKDNPIAEMLLIMCYSGFRISAYKDMHVDLEKWYFEGGVKTPTSKKRVVPIHSGIKSLVVTRIDRDGGLLTYTPETFRKNLRPYLAAMGIEDHTPHDCRHTFSALCEKYHVAENDRKRMLGHKFKDITNGVYGHRTVEDLRNEIEKIKICY